jgi:hypothetical protein
MRTLLFVALFACASFSAAEPLPMNLLMNDQELEKTGMKELTPQQRQAFEKWAGEWTQKVLDQSKGYHRSIPLKQWVTEWPLAEQANPNASQEEIAEQQKQLNKVVDKIRDNGAIVELKDGSIWKISELDRKKTVTWNRGDKVNWEKTSMTYPPYRLHNLMENNINPTVNQVADAEMIVAPSSTGKKSPYPAEYYKGSTLLSYVHAKGWEITMEDKAVWKIAPRDWQTVLRWEKADRIKVEKTNDLLYPYKLLNLDNGEQALANKK